MIAVPNRSMYLRETTAAPKLTMSARLRGVWFPIALAREADAAFAAKRPLARRLLGQPVVVFPDERGATVALDDRGLHRGVSLSLGRAEHGTVRCPYHGLRFDGQGACVDAPCVIPGDHLPKKRQRSFHVRRADGTLWATLASEPPPFATSWPVLRSGRYRTFELTRIVACSAPWVLENFVDCAHTGFVHAGLFRGPPSQPVSARIEERPTGVHIETFGETNSDSLLARLLVPSGEPPRHTDELIFPAAIRVDYHFGEHHIVTTSICLPEDDTTTRIFTRVSVSFGVASRAVRAVVRVLTSRILDQDQVILEDQQRQQDTRGDHEMFSLTSDAPAAWVARAFRAYVAGESPPVPLRMKDVRYRL